MAISLRYSGNTINILVDSKGIKPKYKIEKKTNNTSSGKIETINIYARREVDFAAVFSESTYKDLLAWWSYASQGQEFSFAFDSNNTLDTTINTTSAAGQKDLNLTSITSATTGDFLFIRGQDRFTYEVGEIEKITSGVSVGLTNDLINEYIDGDECTHYLYFSNLLTLDKDFNPTKDGNYYKHEFKMVENLSANRLLREDDNYILLEQ